MEMNREKQQWLCRNQKKKNLILKAKHTIKRI